jgi:hypothetical protein
MACFRVKPLTSLTQVHQRNSLKMEVLLLLELGVWGVMMQNP